MEELEREIDGAIDEALRVAEGIGVPEGQVSTLSTVMREVAHAAIRLGYERGYDDGSRKARASAG